MAKKKQKKEKESKFEYSNEILGILLILTSIIGIGAYGPVGNFIKSFIVFLVGIPYIVVLLFTLFIGGYLILKRQMPKLLTARLLGIYIIFLSLLIFLHTQYVKVTEADVSIIKATFDNVMLTFNDSYAIANCGGGMIGAIFSYIFNLAFKEGTIIVVVTMALLGLMLTLNTSIIDLIKKIKFPKIKHKDKEEKSEDNIIVNTPESPDKEEEKEPKVVISSVEELTHLKEKEPEKEEPPKEEVQAAPNTNYKLPPLTLLKTTKNVSSKENENYAKESISKLEQILAVFEISGKIVQVNIGPTVTQYELELKAGTKVSKLLSIQREIALALAAKDVRIQAPIPGKNTIGIELPNKVNSSVSFKEVLSMIPPTNKKNILAVGLGKDIMGKVKWTEINTTPHLLVAGATGSGKSVCMNCIIASILMRTKPEEVKLVMVDPKKVELTMYNGVPHLLCPVVTDPKKASIALKNIVAEMERRYEMFEATRTKKIEQYNEYCETHKDYQPLPYIVVIIDELADLMLVAAKEVEDSIMRITQMARAAGIHLIVATQRPSTDVITGVVKANIPSRISFAVSSGIDSRTILDATGAEKLLGKGDMLFLPMGESTPLRIQGAYVSEEELQKIVDFVIDQQKAVYDESLTIDRGGSSSSSSSGDAYSSEDQYDDPLYNEIVEFAVQTGKISASLIQRKHHLGYNRAARIIDLLEERGIIGPANGSKPREVLVKLEPKDEE
jgi:DNA segregation ATPase FtsK/SpoIIIE, S-DNA-T family